MATEAIDAQKELEQRAAVAHALDEEIVSCVKRFAETGWQLAEALYTFHEMGGWALLDCDKLEEWLAKPELGMSRTQFFRLVRSYRVLVVENKVTAEQLVKLDPSKVAEVVPAIERGAEISTVLADVEALGARDLRAKYAKGKPPEDGPESSRSGSAHGQESDEGNHSAPAPSRVVECPQCGHVWQLDPNVVVADKCWLAPFAGDGCDNGGRPQLDPHHLIPQQDIKAVIDDEGTLEAALADERNIVPACRRHHDNWHARNFGVAQGRLPESVFAFAADYGLENFILHDYEKGS